MPIVFAQPDPVGQFPDAAKASGIVSQYNQDRQYALQAAAISSHAQEQQAAISAQTANANANRATASAQNMGGAQSMRDSFLAGQQQDLQQARGQQQSALLQQAGQQRMDEFTQADKIRLAQMQSAKSQLSAQHDSGILSDDDYQQGLNHIMGIQGPLELKAQAAKTQMLQQQYQDQMRQSTQAASIENMNATQKTKYVQDHTAWVQNPDDPNGPKVGIYNSPDGKTHIVQPKETTQVANPFAETVKGHATTTEGGVGNTTSKDWFDATKALASKDDTGKPIPADNKDVAASLDAKNAYEEAIHQKQQARVATNVINNSLAKGVGALKPAEVDHLRTALTIRASSGAKPASVAEATDEKAALRALYPDPTKMSAVMLQRAAAVDAYLANPQGSDSIGTGGFTAPPAKKPNIELSKGEAVPEGYVKVQPPVQPPAPLLPKASEKVAEKSPLVSQYNRAAEMTKPPDEDTIAHVLNWLSRYAH